MTQSYLDESTFEKLFRENFLGLCIHCKCKYGFDIDLSKEIVHVSFIKLWENRQRLTSTEHIKPYLFRILANVCNDMMRHEKVRSRYVNLVLRQEDNLLDEDNGMELLELKQLKTSIDRAVTELPPQMKRIFEMSRYEGLKYSEIAVRLSISVKTVETQMGRALIKLKQKMKEFLVLF